MFSYYIAASAYSGPSRLTFREQTYYDLTWTCGVSKYPGCAGSQTITANSGQYVLQETFQLHCFRSCTVTNLSGSLTLNNEVFSLNPTAFGGTAGYPSYRPGPLTGTGQVELAVKSPTDTIVTLQSSDASITVRAEVTITAGDDRHDHGDVSRRQRNYRDRVRQSTASAPRRVSQRSPLTNALRIPAT